VLFKSVRTLRTVKSQKLPRLDFLESWLQCREVLYIYTYLPFFSQMTAAKPCPCLYTLLSCHECRTWTESLLKGWKGEYLEGRKRK